MTDPSRASSPWLPNLVGGISIWKLARDLNEAQFFDGRLLVPETEGTDALPTKVRWDVTGLLPLPEARAKSPADVDAAIRDFLARLEKVAAEFANEQSGYNRYKQAFTVPGLDADAGAYYFYDERSRKLCVINWGASPRSIAGQQEFIFGYGSFGKLIETAGVSAEAPAVAAAVTAGGATALAAPQPKGEAGKAPDEAKKKEDEKKKDENKPVLVWGRPWWHWALVLLAMFLLVALALFLLRACNKPGPYTGTDAAEGASAADGALADGALADASRADGGEAGADATVDGAVDAGDAGDAADGTSDARTDGPADGASDAKTDAKADGGDGGKGNGNGGGGAGGGGGNGGGGGGGGGGGTGTGQSSLPHRFHFEPDAVAWRVVAGQNQLDSSSPVDGTGQNFEVILKPGGSFQHVRVQWQDSNGHWHE